MAIRAVAFDVFGTLVKIGDRRSPYRKLMEWMRKQGRSPQPDDAAFIMSHAVDLADIAALLGISPPDDQLAAWMIDLANELETVQLFPDTLPVISRLHNAGYAVGLCSNLAAPYGEAVKKLLPGLDAYALSYEVGAVKPSPTIYTHLIDRLGCNPDEVLFIGDTPQADRDGPEAFGMTARLIDRRAGQVLDATLIDIC